jgi:acetylornithine deacetylase/succinyl-diaminopimelate desuccinylase-like protein
VILDRLEDSATGYVPLPELHVKLPVERVVEARRTAAQLPHAVGDEFRFSGTTRPMVTEPAEQLVAQSWRPTVSYTGVDGMPPTGRAGNVLRPSTTLKLSFRLPPTCDHEAALAAIERTVLADPPYGATVRFDDAVSAPGWNAPPFAPWLAAALADASQAAFGQPARMFGEGGTIPFMGMLGERFPAAQFVVTGVLVPGSNAHGPDEFLHLPTARRVTECIARLLGAHAASPSP